MRARMTCNRRRTRHIDRICGRVQSKEIISNDEIMKLGATDFMPESATLSHPQLTLTRLQMNPNRDRHRVQKRSRGGST
jgi:hypothetical protein